MNLRQTWPLIILCFLLACSSPETEPASNHDSAPSEEPPEGPKDLLQPLSWSTEGEINTDTLSPGNYNPPAQSIDWEKDFFPPYLEELKIETRQQTEVGENGYWIEGLEKYTNHEFTFREPTYIDEKGGKWYNTWDIYIFTFEKPKQASLHFNSYLKLLKIYNAGGIRGQGNESRRFLSGKHIYYVQGACATTWFVKNATNRVMELCLGEKDAAPRTLFRTFCGTGAGTN